ncbi:MAG: NADPH-dependent F420 reductase [Pseudomonadota bacterium]
MFRLVTLIAWLFIWVAPGQAETIAVIGTGNVGGALGPEFAAQGHTVVYGSRNPDSEAVSALVTRTGNDARASQPGEAASQAEIVVLAVPGMLVKEVVTGLGDLSGKILIDATNPLVRRDDGMLGIGIEGSNAEIVQAAAPGADVVKAFNTLGWRTMIDPAATGGPVSIPLVGDSTVAKQKIASIVAAMDLEPIDVGPLRNARHVEGMVVLILNNQLGGGPIFEFYLRETVQP